MVKVIKRVDIPTKQITCHRCKCTLEYTQADEKEYYDEDFHFTSYYITCPDCGANVSTREPFYWGSIIK